MHSTLQPSWTAAPPILPPTPPSSAGEATKRNPLTALTISPWPRSPFTTLRLPSWNGPSPTLYTWRHTIGCRACSPWGFSSSWPWSTRSAWCRRRLHPSTWVSSPRAPSIACLSRHRFSTLSSLPSIRYVDRQLQIWIKKIKNRKKCRFWHFGLLLKNGKGFWINGFFFFFCGWLRDRMFFYGNGNGLVSKSDFFFLSFLCDVCINLRVLTWVGVCGNANELYLMDMVDWRTPKSNNLSTVHVHMSWNPRILYPAPIASGDSSLNLPFNLPFTPWQWIIELFTPWHPFT